MSTDRLMMLSPPFRSFHISVRPFLRASSPCGPLSLGLYASHRNVCTYLQHASHRIAFAPAPALALATRNCQSRTQQRTATRQTPHAMAGLSAVMALVGIVYYTSAYTKCGPTS